MKSRVLGTGEIGCAVWAARRDTPAAPASAVVRKARRSTSVPRDFERALPRPFSPRARDEAREGAGVFELAVDDVVDAGAAGVFAVAFEAHRPRRRIERRLERD